MQNTVTLEGIKAKIKAECYLILPDGRTTVCMLTLENGYTIKGLSACVDAANFDMDIGRKIAFEDALRQIWPLEGYLLAEKLYWDRIKFTASNPPKKWDAVVTQGQIVLKQKSKRDRKPKVVAPWGLKKDGTPKQQPGRKAKA